MIGNKFVPQKLDLTLETPHETDVAFNVPAVLLSRDHHQACCGTILLQILIIWSKGTLLLDLALYQLDIVLGHILILLQYELLNLIAHISLHDNLLASAWQLRNRRASRKLLPKVLGHLLVVETERLKTRYSSNVFPLVALDTLDIDNGRGDLLSELLLRCFSFGSFLLSVFRSALLGVDGEGRSCC